MNHITQFLDNISAGKAFSGLPSCAQSETAVNELTRRCTSHPARNARYRKILVPLDGTPLGEHALPMAIALAQRADAELLLVHVHYPWNAGYHLGRPDLVDPFRAAYQSHPRQYLLNVAASISHTASVRVKTTLTEGLSIAELLSNIGNRHSDLVVMATQANSRWAQILHGSISATMMCRLRVPLLLVRGTPGTSDLSQEVQIRHILTALDGSPIAEEIVGHAASICELYNARHTLLHIVSPTTKNRGRIGHHAMLRSQEDRIESDLCAPRPLEICDLRRHKSHCQVAATIFTLEETILSYAQDPYVDIVALTLSSRNGLSGWFRSNLATNIVRSTGKPCLILCQQTQATRR